VISQVLSTILINLQ